MTTLSHKTGLWFRRTGQVLFGLMMVCLLTNAACPQRSEPSVSYDVNPRTLDLITPGLVVDRAPRGWSHIIIKSQPRAGAGDLKKVPASAVLLSRLLFTTVLANVEAEKKDGVVRHKLTAAAVGVGTKLNDKDTILSPEKQKELGAGFGFVERMVLSKAQEKLQDVQMVLRSDCFALIDAAAFLHRESKHVPVVLRYAIVVDGATGRLETLLWVIDRDAHGGYQAVSAVMEWLPPAKNEDCVLHVDAREFSFGVPSEKAFAMMRVPEGKKQIAIPEAMRPMAGRQRLSSEMARSLEVGLRQALEKAAK